MNKLAKECFAYQKARKYPVHTPQEALKSYNIYLSDKSAIPEQDIAKIQQKFKKSAAQLGWVAPKQVQPEQTVDCVSINTKSGRLNLTIPKTSQEIRKIASYLASNSAMCDKQDMRKCAATILGMIQGIQGVQQVQDTQEYLNLQKMAGFGVGDRNQVAQELLKRANYLITTEKEQNGLVKAYNTIKELSDQEFSKSATLNLICDTLESIDKRYDLEKHYNKGLKAPKDLCFKDTFTDLHKQASDWLKVASTDTILSKKALLEGKQTVNCLLEHLYGQKPATDEKMLEKVASLSATGLKALLGVLSE